MKLNEHGSRGHPLAKPGMRAGRRVYEVRPNALLAILVDYLFHFPVVVLKPGFNQRNLAASLFFRKEFARNKDQDYLAE